MDKRNNVTAEQLAPFLKAEIPDSDAAVFVTVDDIRSYVSGARP